MTDTKLKFILALVILLGPLASAVLISLFTKRHKDLSAGLSVGAVAISLICSIVLFVKFHGAKIEMVPTGLQWLQIPGFTIDLDVLIDPLSLLMLLVVTSVGTLVHVFSLAYMKEDEGFSRYFAGLSLFMFSMLGIVLAANFVMLFIFWELVGIS